MGAPCAAPCCALRGDFMRCFDISFLPFSFVFFSFLLSLSPRPLCSRDAAKRKAWKLNRVGSLRNIHSSSTNTEGNRTRPTGLPPPRLPHSFLPPHADMEMQPHAPALCLQSALWSFHPFVCVFYFTIHVPFSLLKF